MLARQRAYTAANGLEVQTPLLVPAFSSKGWKLKNRGRSRTKHYSEVAYPFSNFTKHPNEAVLISAFDLHFEHFNAPKLERFNPGTHLRHVAAVFIDSGGYELLDDFDSTEPRLYPLPAHGKSFTAEDYHGVLDALGRKEPRPPLIIANFDLGARNTPVDSQVRAARKLFEKYPHFASDFILKPWSESGEVVEPRELPLKTLSMLRGFDVIGITEKDLGTNLIDRLRRVAALRAGLDRAAILAPIHIWGGLDPLLSPLFYFAGAEIFDGVSWLRYAYVDGLAVNREALGPLLPELGVGSSMSINNATADLRNTGALANLRDALIEWRLYDGLHFHMFEDRVRQVLERAYRAMTTKIPELREA